MGDCEWNERREGIGKRWVILLLRIENNVVSSFQNQLQKYIFWPFMSKVKNREEFEGGLEKRKGKGGKRRKKKRVI